LNRLPEGPAATVLVHAVEVLPHDDEVIPVVSCVVEPEAGHSAPPPAATVPGEVPTPDTEADTRALTWHSAARHTMAFVAGEDQQADTGEEAGCPDHGYADVAKKPNCPGCRDARMEIRAAVMDHLLLQRNILYSGNMEGSLNLFVGAGSPVAAFGDKGLFRLVGTEKQIWE